MNQAITTTDHIILAEQSRCAAMLAGDRDALDTLLDDRLIFCHATGSLDDKTGYLRKVEEGRIVYRSIEWSEQAVTVLSGNAILTGRMVTSVTVAGTDKILKNRVIAVWTAAGNTTGLEANWKLVAFQSTPLVQ